MRTEPQCSERGTYMCTDKRCQIGPRIIQGNIFTSTSMGRTYFINAKFDCNSCNVVYLLTCSVCKLQYVGSTNNVRLRMNNHRSRIRSHFSKTNEYDDELIIKHYNRPGHSESDFRLQIIDHCDPERPTEREAFWQYKLCTLLRH